jgi:uncharacterized DUF497 family protein
VLITWDDRKADANKQKHKISFGEALTAFQDPLGQVAPDTAHSDEEDRYRLIGESGIRRVLIVTFATIGEEKVRIITARRASTAECRHYMTKKPEQNMLCDRDMPDDKQIIIDEPLPETGWIPNPFRFTGYHGPHVVTINPGVSDAYRTGEDVNEALWFLIEQGHYHRFEQWRDARAAAR